MNEYPKKLIRLIELARRNPHNERVFRLLCRQLEKTLGAIFTGCDTDLKAEMIEVLLIDRTAILNGVTDYELEKEMV